MASLNSSAHIVSTEGVVARLDKGLRGGKVEHLTDFDIGVFPRIAPPDQEIPKLATGVTFHFSKWIYRSNNSDLALVSMRNESDMKILKMVRELFKVRQKW